MAAFAVAEVAVAEGAASVVARHAALRTRAREVLLGQRGTDLTRLRKTRAKRVAGGAGKILPCTVVSMAEADLEGACGSRRAAITALLVAGTA